MIAKKQFLKKEIVRIKDLIKSIDMTLEFYYKGENVNHEQIIKQFESFQKSVKEDTQTFINQFGPIKDEEMKKIENMNVDEQMQYCDSLFKKVDRKQYTKQITAVFKKFVCAIENSLKEDSKEVQLLMKEYFNIINMLKPYSKKDWLKMGFTISENKEIYEMFAKMHSKLPKFLAEAIKIYGKNIKE